jgi:RsiW-degrading membrane proteinase PrsW (M82 family)
MKKSKWADFLVTVAFRFIGGAILGCLVCLLVTYRFILRAFAHNHVHGPIIWLVVCGLAGGIIAAWTTPYWQRPWYKGVQDDDQIRLGQWRNKGR